MTHTPLDKLLWFKIYRMSKNALFTIGLVMIACLSFNRCDSQAPAQTANTEKQSIIAVLQENSNLPIDERIALFYKLKEESPNGYDFDNEDALNIYGYNLLWEGNVSDALAVFKLVVAEFPESANAYDSLGEAHLAVGDSVLALANYQKSLALNPNNFGAEEQIMLIENPDYTPPTPAELFVKVYTPEEYKADLDELGNTLTEVHPAVFKFTSETDFWQNIENQKAAITPETTYAEFSWMCSDIIASVNCAHTGSGGFYPENEMLPMALRFPLQTRLIEGKLYVIDPLNNENKVDLKDEIVNINGVAVADIIADIYTHISSQGLIETTKRHVFNFWSTGMIAYALDFPETYTISVKGKDQPIVLNAAEATHDPLQDPTVEGCGEPLCLKIINDSKDAVLTISSFNFYYWSNYDDFVKFIDESFAEINEAEVENLIVDVRFNGGGSPESAVYLLRYITQNPFLYYSESGYQAQETQEEVSPFDNAFKGKCYFVMNGMGNSTTGHFMSMVKTLDLGPMVGEELGSNQFCTGGATASRLSNTKFDYRIGNNNNKTTATELPDEVGILPDYYVSQSIDEYLNREDVVMETAFELIDKAQK